MASRPITISVGGFGIVYAMTLSAILKLHLFRYTLLANFPLLGGRRLCSGAMASEVVLLFSLS